MYPQIPTFPPNHPITLSCDEMPRSWRSFCSLIQFALMAAPPRVPSSFEKSPHRRAQSFINMHNRRATELRPAVLSLGANRQRLPRNLLHLEPRLASSSHCPKNCIWRGRDQRVTEALPCAGNLG